VIQPFASSVLPGPPGRARLAVLAVAVLAVAVLALARGPAAATAAAAPPAPTQALAAFDTPHIAYASPSSSAKRVGYVSGTGPIMGGRSVFPVIDTREHKGKATWLRVMLPGRPNGRTGWVAARDTVAESTGFHVVVELERRRALVYWRGHRVRTFSVIVGKASTPTPRGSFFVEEMVPLDASEPGAPFALATSARSDVLERYEGGVGQIALHGTGNLSGTMGTAASHGCVRLGDTAIAWLAKTMSPGVPITIRSR